ncbi:hypothetical protein ACNJFI_21155, partial [Mycobacterium tuberculosis]
IRACFEHDKSLRLVIADVCNTILAFDAVARSVRDDQTAMHAIGLIKDRGRKEGPSPSSAGQNLD